MSGTTYIDSNGLVRTVAANVLRDAHYPILGGPRTTLLEGARVNLCPYSEDFASWGDGGATVAADAIVAPDGATTADTLTRVAAAGNARFATIAAPAGTALAAACFIKKGTSGTHDFLLYDNIAAASRGWVRATWTAGVPVLSVVSGAATLYPVVAMANGWYRVLFVGTGLTAGNAHRLYAYPSYIGANGENGYYWGAQVEDAAFPSSYIKTTAAAVTRAADALSFLFTAVPQAMTVYVKFIELGTILLNNYYGLLAIGEVPLPYFIIYRPGAAYTLLHRSWGGIVSSTLAGAPTIGDVVELRAVLNADGSVVLGQSLNGGAEVLGAASAALTLAAAWGNTTLLLNAYLAPYPGYTGLASLKFASGVRTRDQMRAL